MDLQKVQSYSILMNSLMKEGSLSIHAYVTRIRSRNLPDTNTCSSVEQFGSNYLIKNTYTVVKIFINHLNFSLGVGLEIFQKLYFYELIFLVLGELSEDATGFNQTPPNFLL